MNRACAWLLLGSTFLVSATSALAGTSCEPIGSGNYSCEETIFEDSNDVLWFWIRNPDPITNAYINFSSPRGRHTYADCSAAFGGSTQATVSVKQKLTFVTIYSADTRRMFCGRWTLV